MPRDSILENCALIATALRLKGRRNTGEHWRSRQATDSLIHYARLRLKASIYRLRGRPIKFALNCWYGRVGNNIQQILIAILHAELFSGQFELSEAELEAGNLRDFFLPKAFFFAPPITGDSYYCFISNFFYYNEYSFRHQPTSRWTVNLGQRRPRLESLVGARTIEREIHRVATQYLRGMIVSPAKHSSRIPISDTLVIHLRSGDIQSLSVDPYAVNPLYYYCRLREYHDTAIIVTEPGTPHLLLSMIQKLFDECKVYSGSVRDDFEILRQSRFLATSGVGSFAVAAALLSDRLERFYCSDLSLDEHLNPRMLDRAKVEVIEIKLPGYRRKWNINEDRHGLLHYYSPE